MSSIPARLDGGGVVPPDPRTFKWCGMSILVIDHTIQREPNWDRVRRIANEFDWNRFEVPTVTLLSDRRYRVIEGQHRVLALRELGFTGEIMVAIVDTPDAAAESATALAVAKGRGGHSALDSWQLRLNKGDEHEIMASVVLREHGLRLGASPSSGTIAAVGTVATLIHHSQQSAEEGAELLHRTLDVIEHAYPKHDALSATSRWDARLLVVISTILRRNPDLDTGRLVGAIQSRDAHRWITTAVAVHDRRTIDTIGSAIVDKYNHQLRTRRIVW